MPEKKNTAPRPPPPPPSQTRKGPPSLKTCLGLGAAAALAAGCASTSPVTRAFIAEDLVAQGYDPDLAQGMVECTAKSVQNMKDYKLVIGSVNERAVFGSGYGQDERNLPLSEMPDTISIPMKGTGVELRVPWGLLRHTGIAMGASVIVGDRVYTRLSNYNSVTLGDTRPQVPVCMETWYDGKPGVPSLGLDPTKRGFVKVPTHIQLKAVSRYH